MVDSHGVLLWTRSTFSVPVPVPVPVSDSARRVRSHRSDSFLLFSLRFQIPYWTEIDCFSWWYQPHLQIPQGESDPIDPTRFYFLVYGSRFHTGPILIVLVGGSRTVPSGSIPASSCCSCTLLWS